MSSPASPPGKPGAIASGQGEREFAPHEMFFSITDEKGIILSGNDVFTRVSGYAREDMVGRPHNLVRHPDMPRAVFKLLWDEITEGRPIAAYVKNRAADGRHYWVMATALPVPGGYLSIRIKPSSPYFEVARELYTELRQLEREIEGPDAIHRKEAMQQSGARMLAALQDAGFDTYEAFMRAALLAEVRGREEYLAEMPASLLPRHTGRANDAHARTLRQLAAMNGYLAQLVLRLDDFVRLNTQLAEKATFVQGLADDVQLFALNAIVAASKAEGHDGAAIGAVAGLLRSQSDACNGLFAELGESIEAAAATLDQMLFPVATARLQGEMLQSFLAETLTAGESENSADDLAALHHCLDRGIATLTEMMTELDGRLRSLQAKVQNLRGALKTMTALSLNGRIEAARIEDAGHFTTLFTTIGDQVADAWAQLDELARMSGGAFTFERTAMVQLDDAVAAAGATITTLRGEALAEAS